MAKAKSQTRKTAAKTTAAKKTSKGKSEAAKLTRKERIALARAEINDKFKGRAVLQTASEFGNVFRLRRPTGITSLDIATGGGLPAGGLTQIIGKEGAGKDFICNRIIANLQQTYGEDSAVCLCMTEVGYDKDYGKECGARVSYNPEEIEDLEASLERPLTEEELRWVTDQVGEVEQVMAGNAEDLLEITARRIESNLFQVVIVNSFGALLTKAEDEGEVGDKHYSGAASAITNFMHRVHRALSLPDAEGQPNRTTIIGINQYRENVGRDAQWNPLRESGGRALRHGKLLDILLEDRAKIRIPGYRANEKVIVGKEINWLIRKGKAGCHDGPQGSFPFYFGKYGYPFGGALYHDLITAGVRYGLIHQAGAWLTYDDGQFQLRGQGIERFSHEIASTQNAFEYMRAKCFEAAGVRFITKEVNAA